MASLNKMYPGLVLIIACNILFSAGAFCQSTSAVTRKQIQATHVANGAVKLDGVLDDPVWQQARFVSDFLQKEPNEGHQPTEKVEVAVAYDDDAIYIGARMHCAEPDKLPIYMNRRDAHGDTEKILVALDTYRNRRTAYAFVVNAAGVISDRFHPEDNEQPFDYSYNAVWEAKTAVGSDSWTAEMRIPFSQLRFNKGDVQIWGINFNHWIPQRNEDVYWIYTPRDEVGYASRFGDLVGIEGVKPSRRLELLPYGAGNADFSEVENDNPFRENREFNAQMGADLKMGLGPNLTLDATFNPDFGQVEADPAEVNLSAYETFFPEKRPFFTEGSQLFDFHGLQYFYSRRIGQEPHGGVDADFADQPTSTSILGAGKVTGRLQSGTSIGILAAVTEREYGKGYVVEDNSTFKTMVEPTTLYGVARIQQEFGEDESTAGIMLTGVHRELKKEDNLLGELRRNAFTGGADWNLRFNDGMYELAGFAGFSHVHGDAGAIRQTQESSTHYFQRPDQDHVSIDSGATSMTGLASAISFDKESGRHWLWGIELAAESPAFELNDVGILNAADDIDAELSIVYRETTPGKTLRNYYLEIEANSGWNFGGVRQYTNLSLGGNCTWANYYNSRLNLSIYPRGQSDALTRGGPLMKTMLYYWMGAGFGNNYASSIRYGMNLEYGRDELDGWAYFLRPNFSARVGNRGQISVNPVYYRDVQPLQYVTTIDNAGGGKDTYGSRYIFSRIERSELSLQLRMNYYFSPDLSLEVYAEPFSASGRYYNHGELIRASDYELRVYGTDGTTISRSGDGEYEVIDGPNSLIFSNKDFGRQSFRSSVVLRWEFMLGSTLYLVWQRNLADDGQPGRLVRPKSMFDALSASGADFVALKISYWMPIS